MQRINLNKHKNILIKYFFYTLFIMSSIYLLYTNYKINREEQKIKIITNNYIRNIPQEVSNKYQYNMIIDIPTLKLRYGIHNTNSIYNNVNSGIQIHEISNYPNEENHNIILLAHSGSGTNAYFNNINKLNYDDSVIIYYQEKKYTYKIDKSYEIKRTGYFNFEKNEDSTLYLITCIIGTDKQLVIKLNLDKISF